MRAAPSIHGAITMYLTEMLTVHLQDMPGLAPRRSTSSSAGYFSTTVLEQNRSMFDRITWNAAQLNGQPCVRGMRLTVRRVVAAAAAYPERQELLRNYPDLDEEDVRQALEFAAANLADEVCKTSAA